MTYNFYTFPVRGEKVEGLFYIQDVHHSEKYGGGWNYKGTLRTQKGRIQCHCFSKQYFSLPTIYKISGTVRPLKGGTYALKIQGIWEPTCVRFSLVPFRKTCKESVQHYISTHYPDTRNAHFLMGMITGELEDLLLLNEFNQLGVSHLMAISGLHFSLLAFIFHFLFRLFLPYKLEACFLIALMSCYLFFIGDTPSVLRAWMMILPVLLGLLFERRCSSINALGCALLFSLLWNPLSAISLSLQLSFLATAGILFFYAPCNRLMMSLFPKFPLKEVVIKNKLWQHCYIFISLLREALALSLAVHFALLPLLLASFHVFSFNSLFYNLFFPFLASLALIFFLFSLPFGHLGHFLNNAYCSWILKIPAEPFLTFKSFYLDQMPPWLLTFWLTSLLAIAVFQEIRDKSHTNRFHL